MGMGTKAVVVAMGRVGGMGRLEIRCHLYQLGLDGPYSTPAKCGEANGRRHGWIWLAGRIGEAESGTLG